MKLELANFPVKDVRFSQQTSYNNGILEINKEELVALVLEDKKITSASLDVAVPNEQTRIVLVRDVVEPRIKVSGPGSVFPGILGPIQTVGEGRTHRLSGVTVMTSAEYHPTLVVGTAVNTSGIMDMWGPGSLLTPFGSLINVVLMLKLVDSVTELEASAAIQSAEFKLARRLAETTVNLTPEDVEVFELFQVDPSLPKVVCIDTFLTEWQHPLTPVLLYGLPVRESMPTLIHPNELLDGAVTSDARRGNGYHPKTWHWMNHSAVLQLYREHGKRLNFAGVILQRTRFEAQFGKQVSAECTSQIARLLGADGAIITRTSVSGANLIDVMLTVQACEKKGVKTVFITPEYGGKDGTEVPLAFYVPEATAMVATGSMERELKLPAPTKVLGGGDGQQVVSGPGHKPFSPWSELTVGGKNEMFAGLDWYGSMNLTCTEY